MPRTRLANVTAKFDLTALLASLDEDAKDVLDTKPTVQAIDDPTLDDLQGPDSKTWVKIPQVVAVVADLRNSSQLGTSGRHDTTTARIYEAAVEGAVRCLHDFEANFIDIQGDGGFGLFWGEKAFERAFCAAVTIRTFSESLVEELKSRDTSGTLPETGYKVGIAVDRVLVKTIGTRREITEQEAVWPGRAVNHAVKAAQSAEQHQIVVTERFWDYFKNNDYVMLSCGCNGDEVGEPHDLWHEFEISHIADGSYRDGYMLQSAWCATHGHDYCEAILEGLTSRNIGEEKLRQLTLPRMRSALESKKQQRRTYPKY